MDVAQAAGDYNVVIDGYAYVADKAVSFFEGLLSHNREKEAQAALATLQQALVPPQEKMDASRITIAKSVSSWSLDDSESSPKSPTVPGPPGGGPYPVPPPPRVPGGTPGPIRPPRGGVPIPSPEGPGGTMDPLPTPGGPGWPIDEVGMPTPVEPPRYVPGGPGGPAPGPGGTIPGPGGGGYDPDWPQRGPNVDSGSGGTIGNPGLTAGLLGGGAIAGGAALRWGKGAGAAGTQGLGPGGLGGAGGTGGLLGSGAPGTGGAGSGAGLPGGRGLAGNVPGGGAGGTTGLGAGSGSASGGSANGIMAGGGAGAGGGSDRKGKRSGLGGHIAPKIEDDEDFVPQSDSARAGQRDNLD